MDTIDKIKELSTLIQKIGDIDLYRKIVELQGEVVQLSTRNFDLDKKCKKLEAELTRKQSLRHIRSLYYADGDSISFCPHCWENSNKLIHLFRPRALMTPGGEIWECYTCQRTRL